jgi:hypothetical protein
MKTLLSVIAIIIIGSGISKAQTSRVSESKQDSVRNVRPETFNISGKDAMIIKSHNKLYAVDKSATVSVKFEWVSYFGAEGISIAPQKNAVIGAVILNDAAHPEAFKTLKKHLNKVQPAVGSLINYNN